MTPAVYPRSRSEDAQMQSPLSDPSAKRRQRGQVLVLAAGAMTFLILGVALILEAGNAYGHQRMAQNAADAGANSGATVLAQRLGGTPKTDADVKQAIDDTAGWNSLDSHAAFYTDVDGAWIDAGGSPTTVDNRVAVGNGEIPPGAQGVRFGGNQAFGTTFAGVVGFTTFTASAEATAVTGRLVGGQFLPVIIPVSPRTAPLRGSCSPSMTRRSRRCGT